MSQTVTFEMIKASTEDNCLWLEHPNRIAGELYPDSSLYQDAHDCSSSLSDADLAALKIFGDLESIEDGKLVIPDWVGVDQLEDWIASRAVKQVLYSREAVRRLNGAD